ncbi:MAG TPA: hypothetical protein VGM54_22430 [Chthoniobacter sp.]|jgi:hypothetical protein
MNLPAFILAALLVAFSSLRAEEGYTFVDVASQGNVKINTVRKYPTGDVRFKDVPFKLSASRHGIETDGPRVDGPASEGISTNIHLPTAIYILLSGRDVKPKFQGKQVGEIVLTFTDEKVNQKTLTYPITAGETIREWWAVGNDTLQPDTSVNPKLVNVYTERQTRNGKAITAFLDMYVIELDPAHLPGDLTEIEIRDTSRDTVGDSSPALIVTGITVKHQ